MKKLLALLCVVALLGALCVPAMATENTVPVVAGVPADWTTVYLYAWGTNGEISAWPGVPMTNVEDWWCAYMPNDMENVIINNGSGIQTADLAVDPGMPVCVMMPTDPTSAEVDYALPIEVPSAEELGTSVPTVGAGVTVHAYVPEEWTSCNLYAWGDTGDNGGWPGAAMTKGDDGLWTAELAPNFANIIINDGSVQTVDLAYAGGECWVVLTEQDASGKYNAAVVYEKPDDFENVESDPVPPVPTSDVWYVAGTMNEWNCADEAYKMTANGDGTFTHTFAITAGSHGLKVTNGTWDVSFGGTGADGNYEFTAEADCDVTVNYDGNGVVTVSGTGITDGAGEAAPAPVSGPMYVAGTMNDWNCADEAYKMTDNGDGTHTITFQLTAGAHSLKVTNGTWDVSFGGDGENGNYDFNVTADGDVTVTFDGTAVQVTEGAAAEPTTGSTEPATTEPTADTTGTSNTAEDDGGNGMTIGIIVAVVAVLVGAVVIFFIMKKK